MYSSTASVFLFRKSALAYLLIGFFSVLIFTVNTAAQTVTPVNQEEIELDITYVQELFLQTPELSAIQNRSEQHIIDIPMPGNCTQPFAVYHSNILEQELAEQFPSISTYALVSLESSRTHGRLTLSHLGINAIITSPEGIISITPVRNSYNNTSHLVSRSSAIEHTTQKVCGTMEEITDEELKAHVDRQEEMDALRDYDYPSGDELLTYRLAAIVTGEYYEQNLDDTNGSANNDADVLAVLPVLMSRLLIVEM